MQLSGDELRTALSGAVVAGTQVEATAKFKNKYNADGTLEGEGVRASGETFSVAGSWSVIGGGAVLKAIRPTPGRPFQAKSYWYKLGETYFETGGTAPYEKVYVRQLTR